MILDFLHYRHVIVKIQDTAKWTDGLVFLDSLEGIEVLNTSCHDTHSIDMMHTPWNPTSWQWCVPFDQCCEKSVACPLSSTSPNQRAWQCDMPLRQVQSKTWFSAHPPPPIINAWVNRINNVFGPIWHSEMFKSFLKSFKMLSPAKFSSVTLPFTFLLETETAGGSW